MVGAGEWQSETMINQRRNRKKLLGVPVGVQDLTRLLDAASAAIADQRSAFVSPFTFACANPHSLVVAQSDVDFRSALQSCSAVVADGVGVTMAGRMVGADVGSRITGHDFFLGMMARLNQRGGRVFFLGATVAVLEAITIRAREQFPNLDVQGLAPPFGDWDQTTNAQIVACIRNAKVDLLWVGMTAPKQEKWVHANAYACEVPIIGSIGAVFDFYAQTVERAPAIICRAGLEWLYRLVREPKRLWKRTLVSGPTFFWLVFRERLQARQ
jgi:N-acetylglucosaminyldiphosphoundecaprenol N-acetyl-beta-D-mannosaminyltransferase